MNAQDGSTTQLAKNRLKKIRSQEVGSFSDAQLRDTITAFTRQNHSHSGEDALPQVFAVVNEAINRRQGAWRFFESAAMDHKLAAIHERADRISQRADYKKAVIEWASNGGECWESFHRAVTPVLVRQKLESWEKVLVGTVLYVRQRSQVAYTADILLPACFYETLRSRDEEQELAFEVTDAQVLAGLLLYQGKIVEMNAGEGKTIAAVFPAVLHAVHGRKVHVITANDYLAARDAEWLAQVFGSLGLGVSAVLEVMEESERKIAYGKAIVYGALREFGFDFMRDNLKLSSAEVVQRELDVVIIDEADHALIDEANIPLIIVGGAGEIPKIPAKLRRTIEQLVDLQRAAVSELEQELERVRSGSNAAFLVLAKLYLADPDNALLQQEIASGPKCLKRLQRVISEYRVEEEYDSLTAGFSYWIDNDGKSLCLTEKGQDFIESCLGPLFDDSELRDRLSDSHANQDLPLKLRRKETNDLSRQLARKQDRMHQIVRMIWGYALLKKDVDYLVRDDQVVLIDKYTGRGRPDTRYHFGLQAALEVKEGVTVQPEQQVLGQISVRGYISQYGMVSGMTGTAMSSRSEFRRGYGLDVISVAPSNAVKRTDHEPRMYFSKQDKLQAMLDEVRFWHEVGRPVLIGTHSIGECDLISQLLTRDGIEHNLLNAANDLEEDRTINEAGHFGSVTVATDMAGRGTDIILEAGLDRRIAGSYVALLCRLLSQGVGVVKLNCPTDGAAEILLSAIGAGDLGYSIVKLNQGSRTEVVLRAQDSSSHSGTVTMDFGLGLLVIGTEASDNARVDHQLMGRSGRQGAFGASQFFLSSEDSLLKDTGPALSAAKDARLDSAGRTFQEGAPLIRHLEQLQKNAEKDAESRRARIEEYTKVFEAQSFAYYRSRRDILRMDDFQSFLDGLVSAKAAQLSQKYFPGRQVDDYARQFADLSEELDLDYNVSASELRGVDLNLLEQGIAGLLNEKLDRARERFAGNKFNELGTLLYLQTSDELWKDHISNVQSLILSTQLCGYHGRGDMAAFTLTSFASYELFQTRIMDSFLPRLSDFPNPPTGGPQPPQIELFQDVMEILA
ncbi:MAG: hypothetical protein IH872_00890 [Chloroflexi bacterium]|nr:hypothetical protein [Chloroflexota bacterium]